MKIVAPIEITDAIFTSSTVPETDYAEWSSATAYTVGQKVIRASKHKIYEALTASTGKTPEDNPTDWLDLGATNRWKMFDRKVGTRTTATTSMTVEVTPGRVVSALAVLEASASSARVVVTDTTDGVVYDKTREFQSIISAPTWYAYFFDSFRRRTVATFFDLPCYPSATISITLSSPTGDAVECGVCAIGAVHEFADAVRYGATSGIQDYSKKTVDEWGNYEITARAFAKRASWDILLDSSRVDLLHEVLASLRATPAVYIGSDIYDATTVYGFFKDFSVTIDYPKYAQCAIELEGLI